jgi:hypothetical protein
MVKTQQDDTQHNNTQHNDTQHNDVQHNDTQNNSKWNMTFSIMQTIVMLNVHLCWVSYISLKCWVLLCWRSCALPWLQDFLQNEMKRAILFRTERQWQWGTMSSIFPSKVKYVSSAICIFFLMKLISRKIIIFWHHDIQNNNTLHNDTLHNR